MAGISSLLRSASAARKRVEAQQDSEVAYKYSTSAKTYSDYQEYTKYLQKRSKSVTDASAALTLRKTADSAYKGFVSNEIQRSSINVIEGTGSNVDKYNTIIKLMQQANDSGLYDTAQSLGLQAGNLYVSIKEDEKRSVEAQKSMYEAQVKWQKDQANAGARSYYDMGTSLEQGLRKLNDIFQEGGQIAFNKAAKKFVESNRSMIEHWTGEKLPKDVTTSLQQVIGGTVEAIQTYYQTAADSVRGVDEVSYEIYQNKVDSIANGQEFDTPYGKQTVQSIKTIQPGRYIEDVNADGSRKLVQGAINGYEVIGDGQVVPIPAGKIKKEIDPKQDKELKRQLESMGFANIEYEASSGTYKVSIDKGKQGWFNNQSAGLTDNAQLRLAPTSTGFQYFDGGSKQLFNIATDKRGLAGLFKVDPEKGIQHIQGQYGFDQGNNTLTTNVNSLLAKSNRMVKANEVAAQALKAQTKAVFTGKGNATKASANVQFAMAPFAAIKNASRTKGAPKMTKRADGGFNFTDSSGKAISAFTYAQQTKQAFRTVLSNAAKQGDMFSARALRFAGNDGGYDASKVSLDVAKKWSSLIWGNNVKLGIPQAARVAGQAGNYRPPSVFNPMKQSWLQ